MSSAIQAISSPTAPAAAKKFILISFRSRNPEADERTGLIRAFQRRGGTAYCYLIRRKPLTFGPDVIPPDAAAFHPTSYPHLLRAIWQISKRGPLVYLDTTGVTFTYTMLALKALLPKGLWVFDVNDDLLYAHAGLKRELLRLRQTLVASTSDVIVTASASLRELFPRAYYLGNASEVTYVQKVGECRKKVVILTSVDGRFDFALMSSVATALRDFTFDLYGDVNLGAAEAPEVIPLLRALLREHANVVHHGRYRNADVADILSRYHILFAPYRVESPLVRHIDPIRFYAGLNSGMEIVTTAIPAAYALEERLHIASSAEDAAHKLFELNIPDSARARNQARPPIAIDWYSRADRFTDIISAHLRLGP